jgi:putative transposase
LTHPAYAKPELLAERPNELWSWDISKLKGPAKWRCFHLYAILDVYSRYCVGWTVQERESASMAEALIAQAVEQEQVGRDQLTVHADRGPSMRSKPVAFLLADLGITKTHYRPHTSNDNPYSEAQFKTLKYRPAFPARFDSIEHARSFCREFFRWYNHDHRHSGIGLMASETVHHGKAEEAHTARRAVLAARLRGRPRALRAQGAATAHAADGSVDQQARDRGGCSLNSSEGCLILVDRYRPVLLSVDLEGVLEDP